MEVTFCGYAVYPDRSACETRQDGHKYDDETGTHGSRDFNDAPPILLLEVISAKRSVDDVQRIQR